MTKKQKAVKEVKSFYQIGINIRKNLSDISIYDLFVGYKIYKNNNIDRKEKNNE